jgi:hypothetical protein
MVVCAKRSTRATYRLCQNKSVAAVAIIACLAHVIVVQGVAAPQVRGVLNVCAARPLPHRALRVHPPGAAVRFYVYINLPVLRLLTVDP